MNFARIFDSIFAKKCPYFARIFTIMSLYEELGTLVDYFMYFQTIQKIMMYGLSSLCIWLKVEVPIMNV